MLAGTVKFHLKQFRTPVAQPIGDNIYVDNVMLGATSVEQTYKIYVESNEIFQKACMNLREWMSNSTEFLNLLPTAERSEGCVVKAFGIVWNCTDDLLQTQGITLSDEDVTPTKREVLKVIGKIFDPLGLVTPVLFYDKVFIQELWKEGLTWDEPLPEMLHKRWNSVLKKLKLISQLKIPHFIGHVSDTCNYELVFCDASKRAYATVIYLRAEYQDNVKVNVVFSKLRLVSIDTENSKKPKKEITLPRLELMAVTIGIRAANFVTRELKIPSLKRTIWTDSTCVLYWFRTDKPLSLFVDNRVKEIQRQGDLFYYVPSGENPAWGLTVPEIEQ